MKSFPHALGYHHNDALFGPNKSSIGLIFPDNNFRTYGLQREEVSNGRAENLS